MNDSNNTYIAPEATEVSQEQATGMVEDVRDITSQTINTPVSNQLPHKDPSKDQIDSFKSYLEGISWQDRCKINETNLEEWKASGFVIKPYTGMGCLYLDGYQIEADLTAVSSDGAQQFSIGTESPFRDGSYFILPMSLFGQTNIQETEWGKFENARRLATNLQEKAVALGLTEYTRVLDLAKKQGTTEAIALILDLLMHAMAETPSSNRFNSASNDLYADIEKAVGELK